MRVTRPCRRRRHLHLLAMLAAVANLLLIAAILLKAKDLLMKNHLKVAVVAAACVALSGCITSGIVKDLPPAAKEKIAMEVLRRCGGTVNFNAGGGSGQMGGGVNANFQLMGTCPVPVAPVAAPDTGKPATGTDPQN